jgi:hypothetical protein
MSSDIRRAAEFAEKLADAGHDAWSIVQELTYAADAEEFGWTGARHFGTDVGPVPMSGEDEIRWRIEVLIDADRKKTVAKEALSEALDG